MVALAGPHNFIADWGVAFTRGVVIKDNKKRVVPLTEDHTAELLIFTEGHFNDVKLRLSTDDDGDDGIAIDAPRGLLALTATEDQMTALVIGEYRYILTLRDGDDVPGRVIRGKFTVREP